MTPRWKFVWRKGDWPNELYDMIAEPEEMTNLIASPEHAEIAATLESRIADWFRLYVIPARDAT